jgi:hypothetical protein
MDSSDSSSNPQSSYEGRHGGRGNECRGGGGRKGRGNSGEGKTDGGGIKRNYPSTGSSVDAINANTPSIFSDLIDTTAVRSVNSQGDAKSGFVEGSSSAAQLSLKRSNPVLLKKGSLQSSISSSNPSTSPVPSTTASSSQITVNKKSRKLVVRKLPSTKSYSLTEFETHLKIVLEKLCLISSFENGTIRTDHFIEGKVR